MNINKLKKSFIHAGRGMQRTFLEQQNFRIQTITAVLAIIIGLILRIHRQDFIIIIMAIAMVLILELINTAFERTVDILSPRIHIYAEVVKDIIAAAVLIASIFAVVVGLLVFWPYIFN